MLIKELKLKNFMLFKDLDLSFKNKDIVGIICEFEDDSKKSNFGGKSTILDSIFYALTGDSRAKQSDELIHCSENKMRVDLTVEVSNKEVSIARGRDREGHSFLYVDDVKSVKEGQKIIDSFLGMDKKEFLHTSFVKQSEITNFMDMSPTDKKKMFMAWFENNYWSSLAEKAKGVHKELTTKSNNLEGQCEYLQSEYDSINITKKEIEKQKNLIQNLSQIQKEAHSALEEFKSKHSQKDYESKKNRIDQLEYKKKKIVSDIQKLEKKVKQIQAYSSEVNELKKKSQKLPGLVKK